MKETAKQLKNNLKDIQHYLKDTSIPFLERLEVYEDIWKYLPLAPYLSAWCLTDRNHECYISSMDKERGSLDYQFFTEICFDSFYELLPNISYDNSIVNMLKEPTLTEKQKEPYIKILEAILQDGYSGVIINW